jgi:hypothetical protein
LTIKGGQVRNESLMENLDLVLTMVTIPARVVVSEQPALFMPPLRLVAQELRFR